jgi:hypothetical protein
MVRQRAQEEVTSALADAEPSGELTMAAPLTITILVLWQISNS